MVTGNRVASGTVHSVCTDTAKVASLLRGGMWYLRMACQDREKPDGREIARFFCWRVFLSRLSYCLLSCIGVKENYVADTEVLLVVHCSW